MLNHAVDDAIIAANPAARMGKFNRKPSKQADINPLDREELRLYLETVRTHFPRYYPFMLTLARTGIRLGEALALEWDHIAFKNRWIEVKQAYCHTSRKVQTTKNSLSRRVDMSQQLTETLRALQTERKRETLQQGWGEMPRWVFVNEAGCMIDGDNLRRRVHAVALKKADLRSVRQHDLRHTFTSLLIANGESLAYIRDQLGHSSIQITVDTYGHLVPGGNRQAVDKLDDMQDAPAEATIRNLSATDRGNAVTGGGVSA